MSDQTQEPTMEEILASIRRIISEDEPAEGTPVAEAVPEPEPEAPPPEPEPVAAAPAPKPAPAPQPEPEPVVLEDAPLELTERYEEPVAVVETVGDIEASPLPDPFPAVEPEPVVAAARTTVTQTVVSSMAGGTTVEELVRSIVEPQVRTWLDQNLDGLLRDMLREKLNNVFR
jgi:cell pole-organizing protein PopZ